jgi:uncharacterized protein (TIGR02452 family)
MKESCRLFREFTMSNNKTIAVETLSICERGNYQAPSGATVELREAIAAARAGTKLYRPNDFAALSVTPNGAVPRIEVTDETTAEAARRLVERENLKGVVALNFASARSVGGGFLGGAKAQEEDLCRCSALYVCLEPQRPYYDANRAEKSVLYTDHAIYSPEVPFFRDDSYALLERPFSVSIITMPAPNSRELERYPEAAARLSETFHARTLKVLHLAAAQGHRTLVLGAWGCGAFRNDPVLVADAFAAALGQTRGSFDRVVFAIYERVTDGPNRTAFRRKFG